MAWASLNRFLAISASPFLNYDGLNNYYSQNWPDNPQCKAKGPIL